MKKIINNPNDLNIKDVDIVTNKVRALIIDNDNIILIKYADIFMLPGGKIDNGESKKDALKRELKEELGMEFENDDIQPLVQFENYLKDYPIVGSADIKNKLNNTYYFVISSNRTFDLSKIELTEREKDNEFKAFKVNLYEAIDLISCYNSINPRNAVFKNELIRVLKEYVNSQKLIDMHTHTYYSDGEMSPSELLEYAIKRNVGTISITDHDTVMGLENIIYGYGGIYETEYIKIIPGIELTAKVDKGRMHILGYGIDINNIDLNNNLKELSDNNINYMILLLSQINKDYKICFSNEDIKNLFNSYGNIGRPDIAKLCIKYGYANSVQDAFDKYLVNAYDKIRNFKKCLTYKECIELILKSGGIPVLAHPNSLKLDNNDLKILIKNMIKVGLKGIEVYHSSHSEAEIKLYLEIAKEYNLLVSGGSDFHGKNIKPDIELGSGKNNNLKIKKLSIISEIKNNF